MGYAPSDIQSMAGAAQAQTSAGEIFESADKNKKDLSFKEFNGALEDQGIDIDTDLAKEIYDEANLNGKRLDLGEFNNAFKAASDANSLPGADNLGKKAAALVNNNGEIATKEEMTRLKDEGYLKEKGNGMLVPTDKGDALLEEMKQGSGDKTINQRLESVQQKMDDVLLGAENITHQTSKFTPLDSLNQNNGTAI